MSVTRFVSSSILGLLLAACAPTAGLAAALQGEITIAGDLAPTGGATGSLADATGIDFLGDDFFVINKSGDFAALVTSTTGAIHDLDFDPFASTAPLWSIDGVSFSLHSITIEMQTASFLSLSGRGTIRAAGFDDTAGRWTLSGTGFDSEFAFVSAATGGATPLPEPTSAAVFALGGLLVAGATRRARR